jgi:prepilin-type N-terminal cleavage/methylation domain-containing protein
MKHGFSLVELSIVLVILGLLVGGVLSGQALIHAAELRSVTNDFQKYTAATNTFRDKYFALPGDMKNATSFWGSAGGTGSNAACQAAAHTGTLTCNGDGDGILKFTVAAQIYEGSHYWQHLANAGLIEGTYNGSGTLIPGTDVPRSKIGDNYFYPMAGGGYHAGDAYAYAADYGKNFYLFANYNTWFTTPGSAPFIPEDAWHIDTKLDDGKPGTGIILAVKGDNAASFCTTGDNLAPPADVNATYQLSKTAKDCTLEFIRVF